MKSSRGGFSVSVHSHQQSRREASLETGNQVVVGMTMAMVLCCSGDSPLTSPTTFGLQWSENLAKLAWRLTWVQDDESVIEIGSAAADAALVGVAAAALLERVRRRVTAAAEEKAGMWEAGRGERRERRREEEVTRRRRSAEAAAAAIRCLVAGRVP